MTAPLSQRLFGIGKLHPTSTVAEMLDRLRGIEPEARDRVVVAQPGDTVAAAHALFRRYDLHHLPIVDGAQVVGIVSSEDLLEFFAESGLADPAEATLSTIMTANPTTIRKDATIREAIGMLANASYRCLPVTNQTGEIFDIVTTRDLVQLLEASFH